MNLGERGSGILKRILNILYMMRFLLLLCSNRHNRASVVSMYHVLLLYLHSFTESDRDYLKEHRHIPLFLPPVLPPLPPFLFNFFSSFVHLFVCLFYMHGCFSCLVSLRGQKKGSDALGKRERYRLLCATVFLLRIEPRSCGKAASVLNCLVISLASPF